MSILSYFRHNRGADLEEIARKQMEWMRQQQIQHIQDCQGISADEFFANQAKEFASEWIASAIRASNLEHWEEDTRLIEKMLAVENAKAVMA